MYDTAANHPADSLEDLYDLVDFETRDEIDSLREEELRETLTGLPARPGTKR